MMSREIAHNSGKKITKILIFMPTSKTLMYSLISYTQLHTINLRYNSL